MIHLRCTARVLKRFRLEPEDQLLTSTGRLGEWYANLLNVGPTRWVLCVSESTLLPVIMPQRRGEFPDRFGAYLEPMLLAIGIPADAARQEAEGALEYQIARTASRSMLGSMNDFAACAKRRFTFAREPEEVALALATMPTGRLGWRYACEAAQEVFDLPVEYRLSVREIDPTWDQGLFGGAV